MIRGIIFNHDDSSMKLLTDRGSNQSLRAIQITAFYTTGTLSPEEVASVSCRLRGVQIVSVPIFPEFPLETI